jgi:hypothetical protein
MNQPTASEEQAPRMRTSTVLICAVDPAWRALARMSFADPSWYVFECTFDDLAHVARSVKIDAVVVTSNATSTMFHLIRDTFAIARSPVHIVDVHGADHARDFAAAALGLEAKPGSDQSAGIIRKR